MSRFHASGHGSIGRTLVRAAAVLLVGAVGWPAAAVTRSLNLFEWSAVADIVVRATPAGEEGKYTLVRVDEILRGAEGVGGEILIDLKRANRARQRDLDPKALRLELDTPYLLLLEPSPKREQQGRRIYDLVRGLHGARELPPEGSDAVLHAMQAFIEIQNGHSESLTWRRFTELLEESNPIVIEVALEQFVKFRRGDPELSLTLRPLLDHPVPDIRAGAAVLVGQIVGGFGQDAVPEEAALRAELFSTARRDPVVDVRVAACEAMAGFADDAVVPVLQEIADEDPEQEVRYAAEKLLYERRQRGARPASR